MVDQWMDIFQALFAAGKEVNLLNVYKGVPLSFPAKIVQVDESFLHVETDNHQAVCMYLEKATFVQSTALVDILRAEVIGLDAKQHIATLGNFSKVEQDIGNRNLVRIQPQEPLEGDVRLPSDDQVERGELADLSQNGLAIFMTRKTVEYWRLQIGQELVVALNLPGAFTIGEYRVEPLNNNQPIDRFARDNIRYSPVPSRELKKSELPGPVTPARKVMNPRFLIKASIVNLGLDSDRERYRIGMRILSTDPPRPLISQFIAKRQSEIIREIKSLYSMLLK